MLTFVGITLCAGWSGMVNGSYVVPYIETIPASPFGPEQCVFRLDEAITLIFGGESYSFNVTIQLSSLGARIFATSDANFRAFGNTVEVLGWVDYETCNLIDLTVNAADYECGDNVAGVSVAIATGGTALLGIPS